MLRDLVRSVIIFTKHHFFVLLGNNKSETDLYKGSSPTAYPNLSSSALDDLQHDLTVVLEQVLCHQSLHPPNLGILPRKKSWLLNLDVVILSDAGNVYDALFMASRAALWDTKVPRTRALQYRVKVPAHPATAIGMDVDQEPDAEDGSGFDTRIMKKTATDFELPNYWDEGEVLGGRDKWPVCITMNIVSIFFLLSLESYADNECRPFLDLSCKMHISWTQLYLRKPPYLSGCS